MGEVLMLESRTANKAASEEFLRVSYLMGVGCPTVDCPDNTSPRTTANRIDGFFHESSKLDGREGA